MQQSLQLVVKKGVNVAASLSEGKLQVAWLALQKVMSSIKLLAQGKTICGRSAETKNIVQIYLFRANVPEL